MAAADWWWRRRWRRLGRGMEEGGGQVVDEIDMRWPLEKRKNMVAAEVEECRGGGGKRGAMAGLVGSGGEAARGWGLGVVATWVGVG